MSEDRIEAAILALVEARIEAEPVPVFVVHPLRLGLALAITRPLRLLSQRGGELEPRAAHRPPSRSDRAARVDRGVATRGDTT